MVSFAAALTLATVGGFGQSMLLDFYADWCGPCRSMDPVVKELIAQNYPIRQVNIDRDRALAQRFRVRGIPCFVLLVDGREVNRIEGATSRERLVGLCRQAMPKANAGSAQLAAANQPASVPMPAVQTPGPLCPVPPTIVPPEQPVAAAPAAVQPAAAPAGPMRSDAEFLSACVRLRIEDPDGRSCGSGTIVDTRQGEALILTCGHIFRDSQGKGRIEVDLFGSSAAAQVPGRLISYDLQRDVALVSIRAPGPVATMTVAPPNYQSRPGDPVVTVGCDQGADPTVRHTRVAAVGKYLGPPNIQIDDVPVVGRSGGGLLTPDGLVVGVCNAADPTVAKGLYAALGSIHAELDRSGLAYVYRSNQPGPALAMQTDVPPLAKQMPRPAEIQPTNVQTPTNTSVKTAPTLGKDEQALLDEATRRLAQGAEVIMIVRPRNQPEGKAEVYMLDRASPALLEHLSAAALPR
jgi:thiol-disulfide isomerase/thioredoxin